eukprot:5909411-Pleurochrysis_carterae.AAC.1
MRCCCKGDTAGLGAELEFRMRSSDELISDCEASTALGTADLKSGRADTFLLREAIVATGPGRSRRGVVAPLRTGTCDAASTEEDALGNETPSAAVVEEGKDGFGTAWARVGSVGAWRLATALDLASADAFSTGITSTFDASTRTAPWAELVRLPLMVAAAATTGIPGTVTASI